MYVIVFIYCNNEYYKYQIVLTISLLCTNKSMPHAIAEIGEGVSFVLS